MDDIRSERSLRQSITRAGQPNVWRNIPSPQRDITARDQDFTNNLDDLRFRHVGVSPQYNKFTASRGRRMIHHIDKA